MISAADKEMLEKIQGEEDARILQNLEFAKKGVTFVDIKQVYIDGDVEIGKDTTIGPCVTLSGKVTIGENCFIGQNSNITDSEIGDGVSIKSSVIMESKVGDETTVGPFAYMRPNSIVGKKCKVGDFVEIKNSTFGDGSKASHLTYIGDADVGNGVNLGCGVVFVNYDGTNKFRSTVEDGCFIGCNVNLVSPVRVKKGAYVAAGSTITNDVPEGALHVARSRGKNIEGWVERRGLLKKNK